MAEFFGIVAGVLGLLSLCHGEHGNHFLRLATHEFMGARDKD
jgi:hypothetical protein